MNMFFNRRILLHGKNSQKRDNIKRIYSMLKLIFDKYLNFFNKII